MVDEAEPPVDESEQLEPDIAPVYREALASISRMLSLAPDEAMRLKIFENAVSEVISKWKGIDRSDALDALYDIAESRGFDADWVQSVFARAFEEAEQPRTNGKGTHQEAPRDERTEPPPEPLPFFSASTFEGREPREREWLVKDRIPMRNVTLLGGDGATGKTQIALQLAVGIVKTGEWLKGDIRQQGGVLFFTAEEESDEVHRRLDAIRRARDLSFNDLTDLQIYCMPGENAVLARPDRQGQLHATKLFERFELAIRNQRPRLVVLESSADVFAGNEIDRPQVRQFVSMLRSWSLIDGAAVILLSHPSLSGRTSGSGESGSTAWNNSVRSRLYFKIKKGSSDDELTRNDYRILEVMKSNYGPAGETVECVWREGIFITSEQAVDDPIVAENKDKNCEAAFLRCLDIRNSREQWVNQLEASPSAYAPRVFSKMAEAQGFKIKQLADAMNRLMDRKMIRTAKSPGPPSKQKDILVRSQPTLV